MLNFWHRADFARTEVLQAFQEEGEKLEKKPDIFATPYVRTSGIRE
jgi:hypothetical protein